MSYTDALITWGFKLPLAPKEFCKTVFAVEYPQLWYNRKDCPPFNDFSVDIEPGNIVLDNIGAIGSHDVTLRIYDDISATLKLEITKKI